MRRVLFRLAALMAGFGLVLSTVGAVNASAQPGTMLTGLVTARFTGQPVPGACVAIFDWQQIEVATGCADGTGRYQVTGSRPADYYWVRTTADGFAETWYGRSGTVDGRDFASGDAVFIRPGTTLDLGLRPPGIGLLRGRITDVGEPVDYARVQIVDVDGGLWGPQELTGPDGGYEFRDLWPGHYKMQIINDGNTEYHHHKESLSAADVITVAGDGDTVVDEELIPPGTVELTVVDDVTGAPLAEFCVFAPGVGADQGCTTSGLLRYRLHRGTYNLAISPPPSHFAADVDGVVMRSGEVTRVVARARPGVAVRTTVRDRRTGRPVPNTCVRAVDVNAGGVNWYAQADACSDEHGMLTVGPMEERTFRLLVRPEDAAYGMQWVGRRGGTGDQEEATRLRPRLGTVTTIPDIRLDGAGAITGTVRDRETNQPVEGVCVFPYATDWGYNDFCTDMEGRYHITGLGPYRWPLIYTDTSPTYGWRWSGDEPDRLSAKRIRVTAGGETTADQRLRPAAKVAGTVVEEGEEYAIFDVTPYNARTGDYAGPRANGFNEYTVDNLGTRNVRLHYASAFDRDKQAWYLDADSFRTATTIRVHPGQTVSGINQTLR